jgi:hypothetical protein
MHTNIFIHPRYISECRAERLNSYKAVSVSFVVAVVAAAVVVV